MTSCNFQVHEMDKAKTLSHVSYEGQLIKKKIKCTEDTVEAFHSGNPGRVLKQKLFGGVVCLCMSAQTRNYFPVIYD